MATNQPQWRFEFNAGDTSPIEYGGLFCYVDAGGIYPPECIKLEAPDSDQGEWFEYRYVMERFTVESIQSEWFYNSLPDIAAYVGVSRDSLVADLTSDDLRVKALAWDSIGHYHGYDNLDHYPKCYQGNEGRAQVEQRFWYEAGERHPPSGTKLTNVEMSYSIGPTFEPGDGIYSRARYELIYPALVNAVGLQSMKFGKYGHQWSAMISLGELFDSPVTVSAEVTR